MNKAELNLVLQEGEGQYIEFKEDLGAGLSKEIVAFANASGGRIFLGINDKGEIKEIEITNKLKSQIQDLVNNCDPKIKINFEEFGNILIINIPEGENKPYTCSSGFFMRMGPNSQKMKRDEIIKLAVKVGKIRFDEQICKDFDFKDFDDEKFNYYLKLSRISNNLDKKDILRNLKILTNEGFTNAGVLFFAKEPHKYVHTSRIRCVHFNDNDRVNILDKKEVDRGIVGNIEFAINYLKELVPVEFVIKTLKREEHPEYPEDAYREAIVNAVVHRDYFKGDEVAVEKLKSSIIINNKGGLMFDKQEFGKKSEHRNRLIVDLLARTDFMEKVGTGIKRIQDACFKNSNNVEFNFNEDFFVEIYGKKSEKVGEKVGEKVTENQNKIIQFILKNPEISAKELSSLVSISSRRIEENISKLKKKGLLKRIGPAKGGYWEVTK